jgi:hypothetical protein
MDAKQKLTLTFRVEPGCLGPDGAAHIEAFCAHAQNLFAELDEDFVQCKLIPRYDKLLPETEYRINGKGLSEQQAALYLNALGKNLDEFEEQLQDRIAETIDEFLNR